MKPFFSHICWSSEAIFLLIKTATVLLRVDAEAGTNGSQTKKIRLFFFFLYIKKTGERLTVSNIL